MGPPWGPSPSSPGTYYPGMGMSLLYKNSIENQCSIISHSMNIISNILDYNFRFIMYNISDTKNTIEMHYLWIIKVIVIVDTR